MAVWWPHGDYEGWSMTEGGQLWPVSDHNPCLPPRPGPWCPAPAAGRPVMPPHPPHPDRGAPVLAAGRPAVTEGGH